MINEKQYALCAKIQIRLAVPRTTTAARVQIVISIIIAANRLQLSCTSDKVHKTNAE
jgi:hypothetical protein